MKYHRRWYIENECPSPKREGKLCEFGPCPKVSNKGAFG
jgi:hypothetical protein